MTEEEVVEVRCLAKHFCKRWRERIGSEPTLDQVNRIIAEAQRIRRQETVWRRRGTGILEPYRILAEYWHHEAGLLIRVDERRSKAVTVIAWGDGGV